MLLQSIVMYSVYACTKTMLKWYTHLFCLNIVRNTLKSAQNMYVLVLAVHDDNQCQINRVFPFLKSKQNAVGSKL